MDLGLSQRVAVVSGGAKGIGAATVRALLDEGARVAALDRDATALDELAESCSNVAPRLRTIVADLTRDEACREAIEQTLTTWGRIDLLVNNAGVNDGVGLDAPAERFWESLRLNLSHVYSLTHHARAALLESHGAIINVSSKVAVTGQGSTSGYAAAKGALHALTREWAVALAPAGVRVNAVVPAECDTDQYRRWFQQQADPGGARESIERLVPLGRRLTRAEEIAAAIVFLASDASAHTTGQWLYVDGGYTHLDRAASAQRAPWQGIET